MSTIADVADLPQLTHPLGAVEITSPQRRKGLLGWKLSGVLLIVGLVAFNVWWYWRESRPIANDVTIARWIRDERLTEAEDALRERLRRSRWDNQARVMLARVLAARNDSLACARELHEVAFWSPEKAEARLREGQAYIKVDRARDAEQAWLATIENDPLHPIPLNIHHDACQELLKIYAIEDRWEDAYPIIWKSYDRSPVVDHPVLLSMRLRPELERVSHKESAAILKRYLAADPEDRQALRALARAEAAMGQHAEATLHFQACLKKWPKDVRAWRDYLAILLERGELDTFLALLKQPPEDADSEPETWMYRGVASEKSGDWQAAAQNFRKAIELNPAVPKYYYRLSVAELRLGLPEAAAAHRQRTKEMNDARAHLPGAYSAFFVAKAKGKAGLEELDVVRKRLASLCETLGWMRVAQGWNRLVLSP